jgi:hypothetical protein
MIDVAAGADCHVADDLRGSGDPGGGVDLGRITVSCDEHIEASSFAAQRGRSATELVLWINGA